MLKKSLIALAIASVAGSAFAVDLTAPKNYLSIQGAETVTAPTLINTLGLDEKTAGELTAKLDGEYKQDDIITLKFDGARLVDGNKITTEVSLKKYIKVDGVEGNPDTLIADEDNGTPVGTMTLGLLEATDSQATFRVTNLTFAQDIEGVATTAEQRKTVGGTVIFKNLKLNTADILQSGSAKVTFAARTSDGNFTLDRVDGKDVEQVLFEAKNQFVARVKEDKGFKGTVDVNQDRLAFAADPKTTSTIELELVDLDKADGDFKDKFAHAATPTGAAEFSLSGQFGFMVDEFNEDGSHKDFAGDAAATGDAKVYADRLEFDGDAFASGISGKEVKLTMPDDVVIPHQRFTSATAKVSWAQGNQVLPITAGLGEWKLNGAVYHVPFMPFRSGYSPIVNVSNTSNQTADISVVIYPQDSASWEVRNETLSVPAKAQSQTNITNALRELNIQGDVALDIIVNAPSKDIDVNALFYQDGDRAVIRAVNRNDAE